MATTKVSALSALTTTDGAEELLINDGGTSKKITLDNVTENNFTDVLKAKLDAIEASATADQSNAEIAAAVEAASDSNTFTDADHSKLNAIEASATADQTAGEILTLLEDGIDSVHYKDGSIDTAHIGDDQVTYAKIQNVSATDRILGRDSSGAGVVEEITPANLRTMINVADGSNAYVHPNHSGEVTSTADGATVIADNIVDEANLKVSNSPTNGQFLSAQSGNTGGLTWADVDALPSQTGNSGEFLTTNGSVASWAEIATGNTTTSPMWEMAHTVSTNYTMTTNYNGVSVAPVTINSGVSVTVPTGSTWTIV